MSEDFKFPSAVFLDDYVADSDAAHSAAFWNQAFVFMGDAFGPPEADPHLIFLVWGEIVRKGEFKRGFVCSGRMEITAVFAAHGFEELSFGAVQMEERFDAVFLLEVGFPCDFET